MTGTRRGLKMLRSPLLLKISMNVCIVSCVAFCGTVATPMIVPVAAGPIVSAASMTLYSDAELLALEISTSLLAPPELVAQVADDLAAIRIFDPYFSDFHVFPNWVPGVLLVELTPDAWESHQTGDYNAWDALNEQYDVTVTPETYPGLRFTRLTFTQPYNPEILGTFYATLPGVETAGASGLSVGDIDISAVVPAPGIYSGTYKFEEGWSDCGPEGCFWRQHYWVFQATPSGVDFIEQYGSPLAVEPRTWGAIKEHFLKLR